MPSPFPGMDPYLEGDLWPDVYHALPSEIRRRLAPQVRPRYAVRIEVTAYYDDNPGSEIGIMYPDVEMWRRRSASHAVEAVPPASLGGNFVAAVLTTIHDEAGYDLSIDYNQDPPPPELDTQTQEWVREKVQEAGF
ncbi:MAG: DUF4058 family protein [Candidatus Tectomicrobia bacterium]|nr:DUF4058 family protein [Candidatus Tectomicrobia bacterium]